jgi:hypothetical protein
LKIHPLTKLDFSLTKKLESVELDRSLTASQFFRLVRRPGLKRSQLPHRKMTEAGQARVYSKALVEQNRKKS